MHSKLIVPELEAVEIHGMNRGSFLLKSTLAVGAVYGAAAVGPFVQRAMAQSAMGDIDILNFALTLEFLEADFYKKGLASNLSAEAKELATLFGEQESAHVETLTGTISDLGGTPVAEPTFKFPFTDEASFLELAQTLEDTGVGAYNGAAPMIESKEVLGAAGSIVQIEARHAAAIRLLRKEMPAPAAFDEALAEQAVLDAVKPLIAA
ncbi:MAG: ferritin-like domain-containing protein [Actinobacteria bacterium]|nr:ferritin-like domain-containing protein [Actinomycetota bacterium]